MTAIFGYLPGVELRGAQGVIPHHTRWCFGIYQDVNLGQTAPPMLRGEPREVFVQDRRSAVKRPSVVNPGIEPLFLKHPA